MKYKLVAVLTTFLLIACTKEEPQTTDGRKSVMNQKSAAATPSKPLLPPDYETLAEAIRNTINKMNDTENDISAGSVLLAFWSATHLKWQDIKSLPTTTFPLVMKDSEKQRGKSICASGVIIEIRTERFQDKTFFEGGILSDYGYIYRFIAVKSTGDLVARSRGTICGIVTGRHSYRNSMGGVAHAVFLVGIFNLPENK